MIIFTDVDGTLYDYQTRLSPKTVEAIKTMRRNGHKVYMVTGRSKAENKKEIWDIGFDGMIGGNGSYVEDNGEVLMHKTISYEQCKRIVDWCKKKRIEFYEESNNGLFASEHFNEASRIPLKKYMLGKGYSEKEFEDDETKLQIHGLVEGENLYRDDLNKFSFIIKDQNDIAVAKEKFPDLNVGTWGGKNEEALFGDFGIKGIDKAEAIKLLLDHLKADPKDTIAIGDASADIPMLKCCGIGITFNSGGDEIKAIADYITDDVDKDGFYKAFEHFGLLEKGNTMKEKIESAKAPEAIGPYSQAIATDNLIFVSGQIPVNRETGTMPEGIKEQTRQSLNNIAYILDEAGADMSDVVKTTVLIQHMSDFAEMNEVYATFFTQDPPARACYEVAALPKGALVEIEAIAVKK